MKTKYLYILLLVTCLFALTGCIDEREGNMAGQGEEQLVSFSIRVPGASTPKTKALTEADENAVDNIVLLLFNATADTYTYQPIYINNVTTDPGNSAIKTFTAKVPVGTYDMVILANSSQIVSTALGSVSTGTAKAMVMQLLTLENTNKWNTTSGSFTKIPMWGEIEGLTVGESTPGQTVNLIRMVSKIDVTLSETARAKFALKSVRLYNYNTQGYVAPLATNWNSTSNIVTAPTVPAGTKQTGPLVYDGTSITTTDISCINEIYTFEAEAGSTANAATNTCLVIGGRYGSDGTETFYRVDFANTAAGATTYLDLLRNHHYTVTIADVGDSGLSSPENAFSSRPVDITADIVVWNEGGLGSFDAGGQYRLTLSTGQFDFSGDAGNDNLDVFTDYTGGATFACFEANGTTPIPNGGWLSVTGTVTVNTTSPLVIQVAENTGAARTGKIKITAGNLTHVVTVNQTQKGVKMNLTKNIDDAGDFTDLTDSYVVGSTVILPTPSEKGLYAWDGWYKDGGGARITAGTVVTVGEEGQNNYTAKWYAPVIISPGTKAGGGAGAIHIDGTTGAKTVRYGSTVTIATTLTCLTSGTLTATENKSINYYCPKYSLVYTVESAGTYDQATCNDRGAISWISRNNQYLTTTSWHPMLHMAFYNEDLSGSLTTWFYDIANNGYEITSDNMRTYEDGLGYRHAFGVRAPSIRRPGSGSWTAENIRAYCVVGETITER